MFFFIRYTSKLVSCTFGKKNYHKDEKKGDFLFTRKLHSVTALIAKVR